MKRTVLLFVCLVASIGIVFTGCSKDDDDSSLDSPKYESISGKYDVQGNSTYSSLELGASGNYIIIKSTSASRSALASRENASFFYKIRPDVSSGMTKVRSTSESGDAGVIYGSYTVNDDGSINLNGFGTLKITYNGSVVTNMTLTPTNGAAVTLNVEKQDAYEDSALTNKLSRTWNPVSILDKEYDENGKLEYHAEGVFDVQKQTWSWNLKVDTNGWGIEEDFDLSQVLFSKSGTYLVYYTDGTAMVRNWKWKSESAGTIYYKEIEDENYDDDAWVTLSFSGKRVTFSEKDSDDGGREEYETVLEAID